MLPGFTAFIDATEQEIPKPKNKKKRKNPLQRQKEKTHRKNTIDR
jgi:hypothetical protein